MFLGALYSSIFAVIWIKSIRRHLVHRERIWFIALSGISGLILIAGVLLSLIESPPAIIKENWRYLFWGLLGMEMIVTYYELSVAPHQIKAEMDEQFGEPVDLNLNWMLNIGVVIGLAMLLPGIYFNYRLAFL